LGNEERRKKGTLSSRSQGQKKKAPRGSPAVVIKRGGKGGGEFLAADVNGVPYATIRSKGKKKEKRKAQQALSKWERTPQIDLMVTGGGGAFNPAKLAPACRTWSKPERGEEKKGHLWRKTSHGKGGAKAQCMAQRYDGDLVGEKGKKEENPLLNYLISEGPSTEESSGPGEKEKEKSFGRSRTRRLKTDHRNQEKTDLLIF